MQYAHIANNQVNSIIPESDPAFPDIPLSERFHPDFLTNCVEIPDDTDVQPGWQYHPDTGEFAPPPPPEPPTPPTYDELVQQYIHEVYSLDDELALTNDATQAMMAVEPIPDEYLEYRAYVEECKARARAETGGETA